jgi:hypothetical protein
MNGKKNLFIQKPKNFLIIKDFFFAAILWL